MRPMKQIEDKGKCACGACGMKFQRLSGFDAHRVGVRADRRCLTRLQLVALGYFEDSNGRWRAASNKDRVWPTKTKVAA